MGVSSGQKYLNMGQGAVLFGRRVAGIATLTVACGLSVSASVCRLAWAAQTDIAISMATAPATPRIQPPLVVAAKPGTAFVFTIAATGQAPLTYAATGLPAGLTLSPSTGMISGTMPAAGSTPVTVTVTNAMGSAQATLTLNSGDTTTPTPPLGWNSYDSFGASVKEAEVMSAAMAMKSQLQPYGWRYVVVDYLWFDGEKNTDSNGRYLPSPSRFPSGFKTLADNIHALGLGFGIHIMRGIPRTTVSANLPIAGSTYKAADAGNTSDACPWDTHMWGVRGNTAAGQAWYDSIFAQYAQWGIDFVKVDDLIDNQNGNIYHENEVDAIRKAIDKSGRTIVLSLSPGPKTGTESSLTSHTANLVANANMWRTVNDFWDTMGLSGIPDVFNAAAAWQGTSVAVGHWPDGDMLPLGHIGPRSPVAGSSRGTAFSHNQQVTVMSLWSIMPSPLIFGGNVPALTTDSTGPWTLALLTNEEVLAVNQDALGAHGKRISAQNSLEVWAKDLTGGAKAVALFNRTSQDATVSATFTQLGVAGTPVVRDLWHRMDVTGMTTGISVNVPHDGALMYKLSSASGGMGGAGGGAPGSGGAAGGGRGGTTGSGSGGAAGGAGPGSGGSSAGSGGSGDSGGSSGATGGSTGSGGDLVAGSGGSNNGGSGGNNKGSGGLMGTGSGGASNADGGPGITNGSGGCGCALGHGASGSSRLAMLLTFAVALFGIGRRRR